MKKLFGLFRRNHRKTQLSTVYHQSSAHNEIKLHGLLPGIRVGQREEIAKLNAVLDSHKPEHIGISRQNPLFFHVEVPHMTWSILKHQLNSELGVFEARIDPKLAVVGDDKIAATIRNKLAEIESGKMSGEETQRMFHTY
jgi:hypothetical protein